MKKNLQYNFFFLIFIFIENRFMEKNINIMKEKAIIIACRNGSIKSLDFSKKIRGFLPFDRISFFLFLNI